VTNDPDTGRVDIDFDPSQTRISGVTRHGNHHFDVPLISQIVGNLYQGGCPEDLMLPEFIENLVSLYADASYTPRHPLASNLSAPFHDTLDVDLTQVDSIARWVNSRCELGPTLVNCQLGLNRSALVVARALMLRGYCASDAISLIRTKRSPVCLCNPYFESWLLALDA
jgi:protein-tyrosine phosphatase